QAEGAAGTTRLRVVARRAAATLAALVLAACTALAVMTTMSRRSADNLIALNDALRAVDAVRIELSQTARERALAYATPDRAREWQGPDDDSALIGRLAAARAAVHEPHQRQLLDDAERRIHEYLAARDGIEVPSRSPAQ